jgi:hypothetical protein
MILERNGSEVDTPFLEIWVLTGRFLVRSNGADLFAMY